MEALDGVRVFACYSVVLGHTWFLSSWGMASFHGIAFVNDFPQYYPLFLFWLSVTSFFVMSGFLLSHSLTKEQSIATLMLRKVFRLSVLYLLFSIVAKFVFRNEACIGIDFLGVNNLFGTLHDLCLPTGWSNQVILQGWIIALFVLCQRFWKSISPYCYAIYLIHLFLGGVVWFIPPKMEVNLLSLLVKSIQLFIMSFVFSYPFCMIDSRIRNLITKSLSL